MLSGLNASWSFCEYILVTVKVYTTHWFVLIVGGAVLAWGIIAPSLVATGKAFGVSTSDDYPLVSYAALSFSDPE